MTNPTEAAILTEAVEVCQQILLDLDPNTDLYWEVSNKEGAMRDRLDALRKEG